MTPGHDRRYFQEHLREEIARSHRHGHQFALLMFEAVPSSDGLSTRQKMELGVQQLEATVRECDVVARVFDDIIAVLLVETDALGARDALMRLRNRLSRAAGTWRVTAYVFPKHRELIESLPLMHAA